MKKKLALLLSVISFVLVLGACGTDPTKVDYNGVTYDELHKESVGLGTALGKVTDQEIQEMIAYYTQAGEEAKLYVELCEKWLAAKEVSGAYVGQVEDSFTITKSGKTLTTDLILEFKDRDVTFQLVYNYHNMELTGVTIEPIYSMGEKLTKAALNTVIAMSIVFTVLILICLIISCFKIFPYLEQKKKEKEAMKNTAVADNVVAQIEKREEQQLTDDTELVAVIAAAIAASSGTSTSDFVVRSIRRR